LVGVGTGGTGRVTWFTSIGVGVSVISGWTWDNTSGVIVVETGITSLTVVVFFTFTSQTSGVARSTGSIRISSGITIWTWVSTSAIVEIVWRFTSNTLVGVWSGASGTSMVTRVTSSGSGVGIFTFWASWSTEVSFKEVTLVTSGTVSVGSRGETERAFHGTWFAGSGFVVGKVTIRARWVTLT
jgi:hypothetical protein